MPFISPLLHVQSGLHSHMCLAATLFQLLQNPEYQFVKFTGTKGDTQEQFRKKVIRGILHTDMVKHFDILAHLEKIKSKDDLKTQVMSDDGLTPRRSLLEDFVPPRDQREFLTQVRLQSYHLAHYEHLWS